MGVLPEKSDLQERDGAKEAHHSGPPDRTIIDRADFFGGSDDSAVSWVLSKRGGQKRGGQHACTWRERKSIHTLHGHDDNGRKYHEGRAVEAQHATQESAADGTHNSEECHPQCEPCLGCAAVRPVGLWPWRAEQRPGRLTIVIVAIAAANVVVVVSSRDVLIVIAAASVSRATPFTDNSGIVTGR
jgi:hypothetical protein